MNILDTSIENFRIYLSHVLSRSTAIKYAQAAGKFCTFVNANRLNFDNLPPGILNLFGQYLLHSGQSEASVHTLVAGAKRYLQWCQNNGKYIPNLGRSDIRRKDRPPPQQLKHIALLAYLKLASQKHEPMRTALLLLPFCGMRSQEFVLLQQTDIHRVSIKPQGNAPAKTMVCFTVRGSTAKGGKGRIVPILEDGLPILKSYLQDWRRFQNQSGNWLFPSVVGRNRPISSRSIRAHVQEIKERMGVHGLSPHTLRRTYLSTLHRNGIDAATLARIAGHKSLQTTYKHYLAIEPEDIGRATGGVRLVSTGPDAERQGAAEDRLAEMLSGTQKNRTYTFDSDEEEEEP